MSSSASLPTTGPATPAFARTNKWEDCKRMCPSPDVVLDCGANIGQTATNLRRAYPEATIHCFEPVGDVFSTLQARAAELRILPHKLAVANFNGQAEIHLTASPESNSLLNFLAHGNPLAKPHRVVGKETVRVCRLDDWCGDSGIETTRIDILKIDVQGSELEAFRGAEVILKTARIVLPEVAFVPFYEGCPLVSEIESFLFERSFRREAMYTSVRPNVWADAMYVRRKHPSPPYEP